MVTIEKTEDKEYIKSILLNPLITSKMRDDSIPEDCGEILSAGLKNLGGFFLKALVDGKEAGMFWLRPTETGLEAHTALLPNCRGRDAITAAKKAIAWCFENTDTPEISSYAWSDSPAVAWFCRAVGMSPFNTAPWPNTRNGQPVRITYFKIERDA